MRKAGTFCTKRKRAQNLATGLASTEFNERDEKGYDVRPR
jgi:hypothetical protein